MLYRSLLLAPLEKLASQNPQFVVLQYPQGKLTAEQLFEKSKQLATGLLQKGFKKGDIAVLAAQPGAVFLEIMFAMLMLNGKIAIIDPEMGSANYAAKMKQLGAGWLFADSRLLFLREHPVLRWLALRKKKNLPDVRYTKGMQVIAVGRKLPLLRSHIYIDKLYQKDAAGTSHLQAGADYENLIVYTSGTLSTPKGVLHTDSNLNASIEALKAVLKADESDTVGTYLPHFMLLGISAGLCVKVMRDDLKPDEKIAWIERESINIFFGPPSEFLPLILYCEQHNKTLPASLKHVLLGSAPVHKSFLARLVPLLPAYTRITCTYGMTENLLVSVIDGREKMAYKGEGDVLGKPVAGVDIRIGEGDEIMVRSPQMYKRYFHLPERPEWHPTGDVGKLDDEGNIVLLGRSKEMIIRRNLNIYPALYEDTIKKIKGIEEAAFVGIYDETIHDEKVYMAVETTYTNIEYIKNLLTYGKYSIDKEALPDNIIRMTIPRKGRQQKIDREAIKTYILKNGL